MKKVLKNSLKILLAVLMVMTLPGVNSNVNAEDGAQTIELKEGTVLHVGDSFKLSNKSAYIVWDDMDSDHPANYPKKPEDVFTVAEPEYENTGQWKFSGLFGFIYVGGKEKTSADKVPSGVKCIGGSGSANDPFTFGLVYPVSEISLNKDTVTLEIDQTETLTVTGKPEGADITTIIWSSSNTDVATVDENGEVTGIAEGTADITVSATNGTADKSDDKSAKCTVTVKKIEHYNLWVGGVEVTSENSSGEGWSYDASNKTLTLNNVNITGAYTYQDDQDAGIYSLDQNLTIVVNGDNTVGTADVETGIYIDTSNDSESGALTIKGDGTLNAKGKLEAIVADGDLMINDNVSECTVNAVVSGDANKGIWSKGYLIIAGGTVTATTENEAGKSDVTLFCGLPGVTILEGTVNAVAGNGDAAKYGIYSNGKITIGTNVSLKAAGSSSALFGTVQNTIDGTGWEDAAGTQGKTNIDRNAADGQSLGFKRVQFPVSAEYPLWVGNTQVTKENMENVLSGHPSNTGSVIFTPASGNQPARLVMSNVSIVEGYKYNDDATAGIYYKGDDPLVIDLGTVNNIGNDSDPFDVGILVSSGSGDITFEGEGALKIEVSGEGSAGIFSWENVTVNGGALTVTASGEDSEGIYSWENVTVNGGSVNATGERDGIHASKIVTVKEGCTVMASGGEKAIGNTSGTVTTYVDGTGWKTATGSGNGTYIEANGNQGNDLSSYKKVQFPAKTTHEHGDITFIEWTDELAKQQNGEGKTASNSLPSKNGSYYLTKDVTLSARWNVPYDTINVPREKMTTNLCLNGKTIRMAEGVSDAVIDVDHLVILNLYDEEENEGVITGGKNSGVYVGSDCSFNMYGGNIINNASGNNGGGVCTYGAFSMYNGSIRDNKASNNGGGVFVYGGPASFNMYGGTVSENTAVNKGGGVAILTNGRMRLSGSPVIKYNHNRADGSQVSNVHVNRNTDNGDWSFITVTGELNDADIGISMTKAGIFTQSGGTAKQYIDSFISDNEDYVIRIEETQNREIGELKLEVQTPITKLSLPKEASVVKDKTITLTASIEPENATDQKVQWSVDYPYVKLYRDKNCTMEIDDEEVTDLLTVYVKGVSIGSSIVKVTSNESKNKSATCEVAVLDTEGAYPLWVGGIGVTEKNKDDVLGDRTVTFTPANGEKPATLKLNGTNITKGYEDEQGFSHAIYYLGAKPLNIVLSSENKVGTADLKGFGILATKGEITFGGQGSLNVMGEIAIVADKITVTEGEVSAKGKVYGINGREAIVSGGRLYAAGSEYGIDASLTVGEEGSVVAVGENGYALNGTLKNAIAGLGWSDSAGTKGERYIMPSESGQLLPACKKIQFPDAPLTPWAILQRQIFNAEDDAIITLTEDVTALESDVALIVPEDKQITIDLAGHTLDRGLKDKEAEVRGGVIIVAGSLTIEDSSSDKTGKITGGNNTEDGGGITLDGGSLVINGGNISGNKARYGGGVYVESGDFNLNSGSITENASEDNGGGVYIDNSESVFTMERDAVISNNNARNGGGVFVDIGRFNMNGGTISNNTCTEDGGGVHALNDCVFVISGGSITGNSAGRDGGAVYNEGDLTVENAKITGNEAECGAGIYNTGDLTIEKTEIRGNEADDGGAVYNEGDFGLISGSFTGNIARYGGAVYNTGDFNMTDGMITGNTAKVDGGGVFHFDGEFYMKNGTISENTSEESGGGVCTRSDSLFTMENGEISRNRSDYYGGGVCNEGNFILEDGKIVDNIAGLQGGGVYDHGDHYFTMRGGEITGNTVDNPGGDADAAGGGVYMSKDTAALNLAGNSVITGNTLGGEDNNVYLEKDMTLTVIDELTSDALIGISMEEPGIFTNSTSSVNASTYIKNFSSDDTSYTVQTEAQELKLGTEVFPLWVNGVQVSSVNKDNVLADDETNKDKVSFTPGNGTDPATLTLSGVMITKGYLLPTITTSTSGIVYDGDEELVIVVQSNTENSINVTSESSTDGIFAHKAKVTITGGGKLDLRGSEDGVFVKELIIDDAEVVVNGRSTGVYVKDGDVIVSSGLLDTTGDNLVGFTGKTIKIGKNVSVIASGGMFACPNTIINEVAGTGWTDMAGTEGEEAIPVNTVEKQYLEYKRIKFPSHTHKFIYETGTGENANTITATCVTPDCPLSEHKATLTIHAPLHKTFDDKKVPDVTIDDIDRIRNNASVKYYKASDGEKTGELFDEAPLDPGEYWAEITLGEGDNTATAHVVYTVAKANMMVTANRWRGTYDGKEHSITVNVIAPEGAKIAYATTDSGEYDLTENPSFSDVGSYAVYFCVTKENYNTVMRMKTVEITGAELTDVSVTQNGTLTYNSTAQTPEVNTSAKTVDESEVTFTYSESRKGTYGEMPTVTNAGETTLYYKASASNHEDVYGSFTVTMEKAEPRVEVPSDLTATYGQTLKDVTLTNPESNTPGTWSFVDPESTSVGNAGEHTFKANFTPEDTDNYNSVSNIDVMVTVAKADNPATVSPSAAVKTGGYKVDLSGNVTLNGANGAVSYTISGDSNGCTLEGSVLTSGDTTGTVTVNVTVAEDANHNALETKTITVTITEKNTQTITVEDNMSITYGDADKKVNASSNGNGAISYAVKEGDKNYIDVDPSTGEITVKKVPESGRAIVVVTAAETEDYAKATKEVTVTVNKADSQYTAPAAETGLEYNGSSQNLVTEGVARGGTMYYCIGKDASTPTAFDTTVPTAKDAGTYYVFYHVKGDENYNDSEVLGPIEVVIDKASPKETVKEENYPTANNGLVYNGKDQKLLNDPTKLPYGYTNVEYSTDGGKTWTNEALAKDAGNHQFLVKYTGNPNYEDLNGPTMLVNIGKATGKVTSDDQKATAKEGLKYSEEGTDLIDPPEKLPEGYTKAEYSVDDGKTWSEKIPQGQGGDYTVKVKYIGDDNHNDFIGDYTVGVTVQNSYTANDTEWIKGSYSGDLIIYKALAQDEQTFGKFIDVRVDEETDVLDTANYDKEAGSVRVTLKPSYLETLSVGKHTLTAYFTDGAAVTANFIIKERNKPVTPSYIPPKTGIQ